MIRGICIQTGYHQMISSNECSGDNYMAVSSDLDSGPASGKPPYYVSVGFNIQQQARTKNKSTQFTRVWEDSLVKTVVYSPRKPILHTCSYSSNSEQGGRVVTLRGRRGGHSRYEAWSTRVWYTGHSCLSQLAVNDKQRCGAGGGGGNAKPASWSPLKFPPHCRRFVSETISNGFYALPSKLYVHQHSVELNIPNEGCFWRWIRDWIHRVFTVLLHLLIHSSFFCKVRLCQSHQSFIHQHPTSLVPS
jgi:hypothetical protein